MIAVIGGAIASVSVKMVPVKEGTEVMGTGLGQELYGQMDQDMMNMMYGGMPQMPGMPGMPEQQVEKEQEEAPEVPEYDDIIIENRGCGFNIARLLAEKGREVSFVSVVGSDPLGLAVTEELRACGADVSGVKKLDGTTPVQIETLNILGDIEGYKCNDSLMRRFTPQVIEAASDILDKADIIVMDGSLPQSTIEKVAELYGGRDDVKLFFDPGSRRGGAKAEKALGGFFGVLPGRMEAEAMTGKTILGQDQLMEAGAYLEQKGVDKIVITMKGGGLYYKEGLDEGILAPERVLSFASTAGAGDVVSAAVIAAEEDGKSLASAAAEAMKAAAEFLADRSDERPIDMYNK